MKALTRSSLVAAALAASLATSGGCYGHYGAFNKLNRWNGTATGNKVANSAIHLGLWIIPVYELALTGDFFIFNTMEFFTGKNPFGS